MAHAAAHLKKARELEQHPEYRALQKARERRRRQRERAERKRQVKSVTVSVEDEICQLGQFVVEPTNNQPLIAWREKERIYKPAWRKNAAETARWILCCLTFVSVVCVFCRLR